MTTDAQPATLTLEDGQTVSALLQSPPAARACYVLAHGAGAGMAHAFMAEVTIPLRSLGFSGCKATFGSTVQCAALSVAGTHVLSNIVSVK